MVDYGSPCQQAGYRLTGEKCYTSIEMNTQPQRIYRFLNLVTSLFVTILIISNIASSAKIIDWGTSILGIRLSFDAGTLLFPVSYIFGDVLTEVYGFRRSRQVIWTGFTCLAISSLVLWIVRILPGEATWQTYAGDTAYKAILGGMSSGGIVLASLAAYIAGEFTNSMILARMKVLTHGRWLWSRTIGSTLIGEGVDTLIFIFIATLAGVFPWSLFITLLITNYIFKVGIEILMTPITYQVVRWLKKTENEDFFDTHTRLTPF